MEKERPDYGKMYLEFARKYNPYPVMMSYQSAFGHALNDGLITQEIYDGAKKYYGSSWNYVGD